MSIIMSENIAQSSLRQKINCLLFYKDFSYSIHYMPFVLAGFVKFYVQVLCITVVSFIFCLLLFLIYIIIELPVRQITLFSLLHITVIIVINIIVIFIYQVYYYCTCQCNHNMLLTLIFLKCFTVPSSNNKIYLLSMISFLIFLFIWCCSLYGIGNMSVICFL